VGVVRVIGCGNVDVGDDAAGLVAVARAREALRTIEGVQVAESVSPLDVIHLLEGADAVIVVDAIRTPGGGREPGTVVRVEAGPDGLPGDLGSSLSSHGVGIAEAVGLAAAIGAEPVVVVLGVEAERASPGAPLSEVVAEALPTLVELLVAEARTLASQAAPA
jgi:hydrogenase maturation protease